MQSNIVPVGANIAHHWGAASFNQKVSQTIESAMNNVPVHKVLQGVNPSLLNWLSNPIKLVPFYHFLSNEQSEQSDIVQYLQIWFRSAQ